MPTVEYQQGTEVLRFTTGQTALVKGEDLRNWYMSGLNLYYRSNDRHNNIETFTFNYNDLSVKVVTIQYSSMTVI